MTLAKRDIPQRLLDHLQGPVVTVCRLLKIVLRDGRQYGVTTLDRNVVYRGVLYSALTGFDPSIIASDSGLSVDNGEVTSLVSADGTGLTIEMVARGELDDASWEMLLVNWMDLTMGHVVLDAGDLGEVKTEGRSILIYEIISYTMRLRQTIGSVWSRRCRAEYGKPADHYDGCGVDVSGMWVDSIVTNIDQDDPFRVFAAPGLVPSNIDYNVARVQWITGDNAGTRIHQVEAYSKTSGTVALFEAQVFPVKAGDRFRIRRDCNKSPSDCKANGNFINYKGEPYIPVGDGLESMIPGAQVFGGMSGSTIED